MRRILLFLFLFVQQFAFAQTEKDSVIRILLIPFDRFELHSEFTLEELNKANNLEGDQFYAEMVKTFCLAFETQTLDKVDFNIIDNSDWQKFRDHVKYQFSDKESHFTCNLKNYFLSDYQDLLDQYQCKYLMVVPWYKIERSKEKVKKDKVKRVGFFSQHIIDYDLFDYNKERLMFAANKKFSAISNFESLSSQGLRLQDLAPSYTELAEDISLKIVNEIPQD